MSHSVRAATAALLSLALIAPAGAAAQEPQGASTADAPAVPLYVEEAGTGVDHTYDGSWQFFTGGGVCSGHCFISKRDVKIFDFVFCADF